MLRTRDMLRSYKSFHLILSKSSIFHLPSASVFNFFTPLSKKHSERKVIPFTPEEIFDVVADVDRYKEFLPFCVDSKVVHKSNENVFEATLAVGFKIFTENYTSRVLMKRPNKILIKAIDSPTFRRLESSWEFRSGPTPNTCKVNFDVEFEVASVLHSQAIQLFFEDVAKTQLNAFIERTMLLHKKRVASANKAQSQAISPPYIPVMVRDKLSEVEISGLTNLYNKYAVDGKLKLKGFALACGELQSHITDFSAVAGNPALIAAIFSSFDDGVEMEDWLTMQQFISGVYLMIKGSPEEKARHLFESIDTNRNGRIERQELADAMNRKIDVVGKVMPKVLKEQIQKISEEGRIDKEVLQQAMADSMIAVTSVMNEVKNEIPIAVNQIFEQVDTQGDGFISVDQWDVVMKLYPELVEMMTIDGMAKMVQWASVVGHGRYKHCFREVDE